MSPAPSLGRMIHLAMLAAPAALLPADKRAFDLPDVYAVAQVNSPALSPDGKRAVFSVRRYDVESATSWSELWMVDVAIEGAVEPRQLTFARKSDTGPCFTPDGESILFVSNRSGSSQLWAMPASGGEPRALTDYAPGLDAPVISPDGRWIAATAELWPDLDFESKVQAARDDERAKGKLDVHLADTLLYRHWTAWDEGKVSHVVLIDASSGKVVRDLTPGEHDSPPFQLGGGRAYDFSPDSKQFVFVSNHDRDAAFSTNSDLWLTPIDGTSAPSNLTAANKGWDGLPAFSPDGKAIAYVSQEAAGDEADLKRLAVLELAGGAPRYLTHRQGFDDMVDDLRWSADGRSIFFQAEVHGRTPIFKVDRGGGAVARVHRHAMIDAFEFTPGDSALVYARRGVSQPHELFVLRAEDFGKTDADGWPAGARRLTHLNARLESEVDLRPLEEMWVDVDGRRVHVFLVKPHGFDASRKYPLILNVHGGPQSQWADAFRGDWQVYPGKGYVVAFANPTGSTGYGQPFCDAIAGDWGGKVYRDLMAVTDALERLSFVDKDRMGAMGWSYGGYMMMWMQGHTDRFRCQAAMMGLYDLRSFYGATEELWFPRKDFGGPPWTSDQYERWSPSNFAAKFKTPALVISGELDFRVPYTQSLQYFTALQERGVPSRLAIFPNAGHWPGWQEMLFYYGAHVDWFHRWLGGEPLGRDLNEWARMRRMPARTGG